MKELVTIIVPVYNAGVYLSPCLESLIAQSHRALEIILVDDGSTDGSGAVCDEFARLDGRVKVVHQENSGVSAARNKGLENASGAYLTFVDADDALLPHAVETALRYLWETDADVVTYGWRRQFEDHSEDCCAEFACETDIPAVIREILMHYSAYGGGYPWNKLWRRDSGVCKFAPELYYFEDLEWVIRMLLQTRKIAVCPECLYRYRVHSGSVSNDPEKAERRELGYHQSMERIIEDLKTLPELQDWFSAKYAPEIVNGVIFAAKHHFLLLQTYLLQRMKKITGMILTSRHIPVKIKVRCILIHLLISLHLIV